MDDLSKYGLGVFAIGVFMAVVVIAVTGAKVPFMPSQSNAYDISMEVPIQYSLLSFSGLGQWKIYDIQKLQVKEATLFSKFFFGLSTGEMMLEGEIQGKTGKTSVGKFSVIGETKLAVLEIKNLEAGEHKLYLQLKENGVIKATRMVSITI